MPRPTRPRDPVRLAATIIGLATGEIGEDDVVADHAPKRRAGGVNKDEKARAKAPDARAALRDRAYGGRSRGPSPGRRRRAIDWRLVAGIRLKGEASGAARSKAK